MAPFFWTTLYRYVSLGIALYINAAGMLVSVSMKMLLPVSLLFLAICRCSLIYRRSFILSIVRAVNKPPLWSTADTVVNNGRAITANYKLYVDCCLAASSSISLIELIVIQVKLFLQGAPIKIIP